MEEVGWSPYSEFKLLPASLWLQDSFGDKRTVCQLIEHSPFVPAIVRSGHDREETVPEKCSLLEAHKYNLEGEKPV